MQRYSKLKPFFLKKKSNKNNYYTKYSNAVLKKFYFGKSEIFMDSSYSFTPPLNIKIKDVCNTFKYAIVNAAVDVSSKDTAANPFLVFDLHQGNKTILWNSSELKNYNNNPIKNTIYISHVFSKQLFNDYPDAELSIYVWNREKNNIILSNFQIEIIEGNPNIFKLFLK